ncbi:hypothetical protein Egran_05836 [Elaphomyces granulatus]|uniref:Transcription factor Rba50 n=1 Tax=Elaphomyces granulatus TaxID=519963 RepID=A0A232LQF8_9EURO|nr:hypothetical protein Egran_05836 [Elaphomyces granulatus]
MAFRGERFVLNFSDDDDDDHGEGIPSTPHFSSKDLIGDIKERTTDATTTPSAPRPSSSSSTGFPSHKIRSKQSAFKQRRSDKEDAHRNTSVHIARTRLTPPAPSAQEERRSIDDENRRRLMAMSPAQIEKERADLMSALSPSLIERLLRRAHIDQEPPSLRTATPKTTPRPENQSKSASFDVTESSRLNLETENRESQTSSPQADTATGIDNFTSDERPPPYPPEDIRPASEFPSGPIHFPTPPPRQHPMPNLDPSSPSFLADLQTHYFPDTPHNPSTLSWLQLPSRDPHDPDASSAYHPASIVTSVSPSALRFSLSGTVLSPSTSLSLPTSLGLHHHAQDPEAAGYTIPELAILSRSTLPAQRCIAWQVIGRILFRLGKGEFGERGSALVEGLWSVVEREGVVARMLEEAGGESDRTVANGDSAGEKRGGIGRHASAKAWAVEGVWLWRKGGGDRGISKEGLIRSK